MSAAPAGATGPTGIELWGPVADAVDLRVPVEHRVPIAVVGAGAIVDVAHLPAYRAAGLEVVGIHDIDATRAEDVARRHGIDRVYGSLDEVLADERVQVIDVAVVATAQPDIVRAAVAAGKHLLCQKPFAPDVTTAEELRDLAEAAGVRVAVNQQLRFDEGIAVARAVAEAGWIGEPTALTVHVDIATDFGAWPWLLTSDRLEIAYHSIHYLDAIRSILGDPTSAYCAAGRRPGQAPAAETRTMTTLRFPSGASAGLHVNHENLGGDARAEFRLDGSEGSVRGELGMLLDYPHGRPDTVELFSRVVPTDGWVPFPVTRRWIPDAFAGPMKGLLRWIATGEPAPTSAADNVGTLRLVEALYASIASGRAEDVDR
ncbi:Gfo/Idh/MocA family protein [Nocardioides sp. CPCC 205120]|uniref:Gfo/Idh/MocA family protein n=1 Tax=Nocardioides sp. CPCC 205120 TaxID=3406462 RepID=UPI003B508728